MYSNFLTSHKDNVPQRLHALDFFRGLCALGVAAYHIGLWGKVEFSETTRTILALFGTYGVSAFFILSGYSLAHAYERDYRNRIESSTLLAYFRRRVGRLAPLFVSVLFATLAGKLMMSDAKPIEPMTAVLNAFLIFGFVDSSASPVIGGWSIGVEIVFYVFFPLLMLLRAQITSLLALSTLLAVWVSLELDKFGTLEEGWRLYVLPANHWLFFCAGAYARLHIDFWRTSQHAAVGVILGILLVASVCSMNATELQLVTGWRRIIFVILSIVLIALVARLSVSTKFNRLLCSYMGGASFSLYLIHPLIFYSMRGFIDVATRDMWLFFLCLSLGTAIAMDRFIDLPLQRHLKQSGW